ncbi:hypothetical protein M1523_04865 [Patescibacteria group bacterium]|nr:hypothetical protein [Patescibacteria group bacterium]MCL5091582.1 hypothetical protein [Patescibacteria group bacterium]
MEKDLRHDATLDYEVPPSTVVSAALGLPRVITGLGAKDASLDYASVGKDKPVVVSQSTTAHGPVQGIKTNLASLDY